MAWFNSIEVNQFDLHLRVPKASKEHRSGSAHRWITCHEGIKTSDLLSLAPWWRHLNARGADVYFRPHRFAAHKVLFLDDVSDQMSEKIANKYASAVIQTSPNSNHIWLHTSRALERNARYLAQAHLGRLGVSDLGSISGDHLGRLCGVRSYKRGSWVNARMFSTPRPYEAILENKKLGAGAGGVCSSEKNTDSRASASEKDFGIVLRQLRQGVSIETIRNQIFLEAFSRKKSNPKDYTTRTIDKAVAIFNSERGHPL
jgi:hypothetical protein